MNEKETKKERVVVGLSGGVDSSVAAQRLKEQGYDVVGLFMVNWHDTVGTLSGECPWEDDRLFAELVAKRLDIPFRMVDLSEQYRERVVDYMFAEYERGRTPNPDVLCNREIKFDVFLQEAMKLGADWVATGHYCRVEHLPDGIHRLLAGSDPNKDQSYFLCQLSQEQLSRALFPVGDMLKPEVREVAAAHHLATAKRKDSQGICFVGKVDLPVFLQQKLAAKRGRIVEIAADWEGYRGEDEEARLVEEVALESLATPYTYQPSDGKKVGSHSGAHFYTIGQRHGLGVGGTPLPLFVIQSDVERNIVYVGQGHTHPGLLRRALHIRPEEMHWVREDLRMEVGEEPRRYMVRIRYRQPLQSARLFVTEQGGYILFDEPQRGITPGQFAAWYDGDELIGSGVIDC
ncbi:MAG: tRNA 2-thiouridine(34) synthase MnmA [Tidjanibacter sp.]|nr:tRNA 2-thiouridine(34) synthase MnmA [Tidjanibacter sp.]